MSEHNQQIAFLESGTSTVPDCFVRLVDAAAPVLVAIHGISRNAAEVATRLAQHPAFAEVNIIAPLFDRGRFGQYQQLVVRKPDQTRSDTALFALLDQLSARFGMDTDKVLMFGFSGGAQLAHRITLLYPHRVRALCAAAAGWYLMPDAALPYPYGMQDAPGTAQHPAAALELPIRVLVGNHDRRIDETVRMDPEIVLRQGSNRLSRARSWILALREQAQLRDLKPDLEMIVLQGGTHDFGQCVKEAGLIDQVALALLPMRQASGEGIAKEGIEA